MSVFDDAIRKMDELKDSINPTIRRVFDENYLVIKDLQVNKQLFEKGEDSKGSIIRPAYTAFTISLKKLKNQPTDRVTWKDTGLLHDTLSIVAHENELEITTSVPYAKKLFKKYGDDVLGIQNDLILKFTVSHILPELKRNFDDKLTKP